MRSMSLVLVAIAVASQLPTLQAIAQDWPQWQGPDRNGVWNETGTLTHFPDSGPKVLWRTPVANGFSGPAVAEGRVFVADYVKTQGDDTPSPGKRSQLKGTERLHCLDAKTGTSLWTYAYDCDYNFSYPNGPRATPTVDGERVYFLGAEGILTCLSVDQGEKIWTIDLKKQYSLEESPYWGFAAHPLVDGDNLYCVVGTTDNVVACFDKMTGKEKWTALSARSQGYCPPTMIEAGGKKQLLIWHPESLNSLNPENGEVYWSFKMEPAYDMSIIAPIRTGDYVYAAALQGTSILLKLDADKPKATEVWRGNGVHPDHNPPLVVDDHIYGVDESGQLRCIDLMTGERVWESMATATNGRPNNSTTGFIVSNQDHFYIMTEQGELIIAKMSPEAYVELDRAKILEPTSRTSNRTVVWSHPAFAQKCMFARNDREIVCISLSE
jgi:outer membrane protein assembly factor BamB